MIIPTSLSLGVEIDAEFSRKGEKHIAKSAELSVRFTNLKPMRTPRNIFA